MSNPIASAPATVHSVLVEIRGQILDSLGMSDVPPHGVMADRHEDSELGVVEWMLDHWTGEPAVTWVPNENCCESCGCPAPYAEWVEARGGYCEGCFAIAYAATQKYLSTLK